MTRHRVSVSTRGRQVDNWRARATLPSFSADGRFVAFSSDARTLVPGDTNDSTDALPRDRDADGDGIFGEPDAAQTVRVSVSTEGAQGTPGSLGQE